MLDPEGHKIKTAKNRESSADILKRNGISFTSHNDGAHLIVKGPPGIVDFWPGTGKWKVRKSGNVSRGVFPLMLFMKPRSLK